MKRFFTKLSFLLTVGAALVFSNGWGQNTCDAPATLSCGAANVISNTAGVANDNATSGAITCVTTVGTAGQQWYAFTPPVDGTFTLSTINPGSDYDTKIHVYTGSCGAFACVTGNDDSAGTPQSLVTFNGTAGTTYTIRVGGWAAEEGAFELSLACVLASSGCTNSAACNFSAVATEDDGSCCLENCLTLNMFDTWGDGWNGNVATIALLDGTVLGTATIDLGNSAVATFCVPDGCYTITVDGGLFQGEVSWELLGADGGSILGGAPAVDLVFGVNETCIPGCTDILSTNYDPNATVDDGSCVYCGPGESLLVFNMTDDFGDGWNGAQYFITDDAGSLYAQGSLDNAANGDGNEIGQDLICLIPGCYFLTVTPGNFDEEIGWNISDQSGAIILEQGIPLGSVSNFGFAWGGATGCAILGCTDEGCNNYNPFATEDDGSCICPPANDDCANAVPIGCGTTVTGSVANATADPNAGTCGGVTVTTAGVWYYFQGDGTQVTLDLCDAGWDTKMHVYTGSCAGLVCVAGNDDSCGLSSSITFAGAVGVDYYVLVSRFGAFTAQTEFTLNMACTDCPSAPVNDDCSTAFPLPDGVSVSGSLCCTNPDDISSANPFGTGYGVWYTMNSGDFDTFDFTLTNGDSQGADANDGFNVALLLFEEGPNGCVDLDPLGIGCVVQDQCAGDLFAIGVTLTPNTDYYFLVYTTNAEECGNFTLIADIANVGCTDAGADNFDPTASIDDGSCTYSSAPANDLCSGAIALVCGNNVVGSTGGATNTGAPAGCNVSTNDVGVWYTFAGNGQFHTLSSCGSAIDSRIEVYSSANGCAGPYNCIIGENDDASDEGCGFFDGDDASVSFISEIGITYYVYITSGGVDTDGDFVDDLLEGAFDLSFECSPVVEGCLNDCACNYNPNANVDDDSCEFFSCVTCTNGTNVQLLMTDVFGAGFGDGWNGGTYTLRDSEGNVITTGSIDAAQCSEDNDNFPGPETGFDILCLEDGCYSLQAGGGQFPGEIGWQLVTSTGTTLAQGNTAAGEVGFTIGSAVCGCTDNTACNFDPAATDNDGSCEFTSCAGCTDNTACNFDPNATIADPAQCCYGECVTLNMNDSFGDGWNGGTATIINAATGLVAGTGTFATGSSATAEFCLESGCYRLVVGGGTFPGEMSWTLLGANGGILSGVANTPNGINFSVGDGNCTPGCQEPLACNYSPTSGLSDCTLCEYTTCLGCTYPDATNYNADASIDDGSCIIEAASSCPSDINGDGLVGIQDLIIFIAAFGSICEE